MKDNSMNQAIFREYDIRGIVNGDFTIDESYFLGKAIVHYLKTRDSELSRLVIGRDGRVHSTALWENFCRAFSDEGLEIVDLGVCPTPVFYFALQTSGTDSGIMITASHNPKEYNGVKMMFKKGSISGAEIQKIKNHFLDQPHVIPSEHAPLRMTTYPAISLYVAQLGKFFDHLKNRSVPVMIDCGNGAAGSVIPQLIQELGWKDCLVLNQPVDGTFPTGSPDPTIAKNLLTLKKLLTENTQIIAGVAYDGDCDRVSAMTPAGDLIAGDRLLGVFAHDVLQSNPGAAVVCDIKSSVALKERVTQDGGTCHMSPSGHSHIKKAMRESNAILAGELSCHFFFKDRYFGYDDGIYASLRLIELLLEKKCSLEDLLSVIPQKISSPELTLPVDEDQKRVVIAHVRTHFQTHIQGAELITVDGVRAHLPYGWGLVRQSNTQPILTLRFESETTEGLNEVKECFINALKEYYSEEILRKSFEQ